MDFIRNTDDLIEQAENAAKEELKNYSDIGNWEPKSFEFDLNVVINGEGIAKFDVPQKQVTEHEKSEMENEAEELVK